MLIAHFKSGFRRTRPVAGWNFCQKGTRWSAQAYGELLVVRAQLLPEQLGSVRDRASPFNRLLFIRQIAGVP